MKIKQRVKFNFKEPLKKKTKETCKYDREQLKFGFSWTHGLEMKMRIFHFAAFVSKNQTSESTKPSNLKRHFVSKHYQYIDKPTYFLENKLNDLNQFQKVI